METIWSFVLLPVALGLLGFIEPCSIGASMLFIKSVEGQPAATRLKQAAVFMLTRALFIGALGALAAFIGAAFVGLQRSGWLVLGALYGVLGLVYLTGYADRLMRTLGPSLSRLSSVRGACALGVLLGSTSPPAPRPSSRRCWAPPPSRDRLRSARAS